MVEERSGFPPHAHVALRLAGLVVLWTFAALMLAPSDEKNNAVAAPHTVSPVAHPFDPDWLDVKLMLEHKCLGCHLPDSKDRTDLSSYQAVLAARTDEGEPVVSPGRPQESTLWEYVAWNALAQADSPHPDEPMMPEDKHEWLTPGQLEIVHRWISNGALEYVLPGQCNARPLVETDFPSAKVCAACHPKQFKEWSRSMHAYAQHSPIFEAFNLTLIERTGGTIGTFCSRCHTPLGTAMGENGSRRNVNRSRISREAVTCVVCHRRNTAHYKSSGRVPIQPGEALTTCMYGPFESSLAGPSLHPSAASPYIKSSQFCGECHDVITPNGIRNEEAFSEWQNSPAAKARITCQHCHMGPVQGVAIADCDRPLGRAAEVPGLDPKYLPLRPLSDHTFAGPDYSLLPDTEFPYKLDWMYEIDYRDVSRLTPYQQRTLTELRRKNREALREADQKRYEVLGNAARIELRHPPFTAALRRTHIEVDVVSKFSGHSFPTGFTEERNVWVSIEVRDVAGQLVFVSGDLDSNGDLRDEHSHEVLAGRLHHDKHLFSLQNNFAVRTNKGTERTLALPINRHLLPVTMFRPSPAVPISFGRPETFRIARGSLAPLRTLSHKYPVAFPCAGVYEVTARLNFRHLPPATLDEIGTPHLKHLLEIVVIDEQQSFIEVH